MTLHLSLEATRAYVDDGSWMALRIEMDILEDLIRFGIQETVAVVGADGVVCFYANAEDGVL